MAYLQGIATLKPHFFLFWQELKLFNAFFREIITHVKLLIIIILPTIQTFNC